MGNRWNDWHAINPVLTQFGKAAPIACKQYRQFVQNGISQGRRKDLVGRLLPGTGGWTMVKSLRNAGQFLKSNERIPGDSDFVENVLHHASEALER